MKNPKATLVAALRPKHNPPPTPAPENGADKKLVNFRLDPEVLRQLKMLAVEKGKPMQALLCDGLNKIFIENNRPPIAK
jgi:hypothetical protein